jgi:hypothetical protein
MSRLDWNGVGERFYEAGVDRGVLYVPGQDGVPWNGLTAVSEKPSGGDVTAYYYDGQKYLNVSDPEEYVASIEAFTYPDEFMACDGTGTLDLGFYIKHQPRSPFSMSYRSLIGNDTQGTLNGYKIHLIYNAMAEPTSVDHKSLTDAVDPDVFSWDISVLAPVVYGFRGSGHYVIDSRKLHAGALIAVEDILYGTDSTDPRIPAYDEILTVIASYADITVVDNGDGTYTIVADDDALMVSTDEFTLTSLSATISGDEFTVISA